MVGPKKIVVDTVWIKNLVYGDNFKSTQLAVKCKKKVKPMSAWDPNQKPLILR